MKVMILSRGYPSKKYKLNGIFEFDQAKALVRAGISVVFAVVDMRSLRRRRKWGLESFVRDGVNVEAINVPCGRLPQEVFTRMSVSALETLFKRVTAKFGLPEVIHSHFIQMGYLSARHFGRYGIPLVHTEHYSGMNTKNITTQMSKLGDYTYRHMDRVIAVSGSLAKNVRERFGVDVTVVPNIVDLDLFSYDAPKRRAEGFNFISVGNLTRNKRMDVLIDAFHTAFFDQSNVTLWIYGDGPERPKLEQRIRSYRLEHRVTLGGLVTRSQIADKMKQSDCFVLVSESETFGVAYVEAMAMGLPVIATKCGGPEDFVTESNGLLVRSNDVESVVEGMKTIHQSIACYDRAAISSNTKKVFSARSITKELIDIYTECIG